MADANADRDIVFVDLSNVSKDPLLGFSTAHASLARWDRLLNVWLKDRPGPVRFILVADTSLRAALSRADAMRLDQMVAGREALAVPDADIEVLRRAIQASGVALSNDRFVDHRRLSGLQRVRLVGWVVRGQTVRLQERSLDRLLSAVISARAQKQVLKELGLSADALELRYKWFCTNGTCERTLITVPLVERGSAMCPNCDSYLDRGDAWRSPVWLKIMHRKDEVARFVLEDGEVAYVGRGTGDDIVSLAELSDHTNDVLLLDERHAELANQGGTVRVRDMQSKRGTAFRRPADGVRNILTPPMPLGWNTSAIVGEGVKIVLGRTPFTVQISGTLGDVK